MKFRAWTLLIPFFATIAHADPPELELSKARLPSEKSRMLDMLSKRLDPEAMADIAEEEFGRLLHFGMDRSAEGLRYQLKLIELIKADPDASTRLDFANRLPASLPSAHREQLIRALLSN